MKTKKIIQIIIDNICHDKYAYDPTWRWDWLPPIVKECYNKILPILIMWEEKGYINLIEDGETIFIVHPEKLPEKEKLIEESMIFINNR